LVPGSFPFFEEGFRGTMLFFSTPLVSPRQPQQAIFRFTSRRSPLVLGPLNALENAHFDRFFFELFSNYDPLN